MAISPEMAKLCEAQRLIIVKEWYHDEPLTVRQEKSIKKVATLNRLPLVRVCRYRASKSIKVQSSQD
ncbi:unnamed protein product [Acanthoscelides obtectus]|uniref:Uncharacterized protein n=1 Tax=Acanthoscelides obtectus TaxID=200917 RepID=A0A9P0LTP9_ACAOB|nr:unnamed protein product [Acanthoscelides obtectus]CAK1671537.1 hypothetical protein AOBTE_LOCUS28306 [Acanthoscelides obtectus]